MPRYTDLDLLIDKVEETTWYHINKNGELVAGANSKTDIPLYKHSDIKRVLAEAPIADVVAESKWISVEDRLPEKMGYYLTSTIKGVIQIGAFFSYYASNDNPQFKYDVTHWMPLPEPPKMKNDCITCKNCKHLMFSDMYGECSKGHKGIVNPWDTCEYAERI